MVSQKKLITIRKILLGSAVVLFFGFLLLSSLFWSQTVQKSLFLKIFPTSEGSEVTIQTIDIDPGSLSIGQFVWTTQEGDKISVDSVYLKVDLLGLLFKKRVYLESGRLEGLRILLKSHQSVDESPPDKPIDAARLLTQFQSLWHRLNTAKGFELVIPVNDWKIKIEQLEITGVLVTDIMPTAEFGCLISNIEPGSDGVFEIRINASDSSIKSGEGFSIFTNSVKGSLAISEDWELERIKTEGVLSLPLSKQKKEKKQDNTDFFIQADLDIGPEEESARIFVARKLPGEKKAAPLLNLDWGRQYHDGILKCELSGSFAAIPSLFPRETCNTDISGSVSMKSRSRPDTGEGTLNADLGLNIQTDEAPSDWRMETGIDLTISGYESPMMKLEMPVLLRAGEQESRFDLNGSVVIESMDSTQLDLKLTGASLHLKDFSSFIKALKMEQPTAGERTMETSPVAADSDEAFKSGNSRPFWKSIHGRLAIDLGALHTGNYPLENLKALIHVEPSGPQLDYCQATYRNGDLDLSGQLSFDPEKSFQYKITGDVSLSGFTLFRPPESGKKIKQPLIDGKLALSGRYFSDFNTVLQSRERWQGEFKITSEGGGVCRLLKSDAKTKTAVAATSLLGLFFRSDKFKVNDALAVNQIADRLSNVPYEQFSLGVVRDKNLDTHLQEILLLGPTLRVRGAGIIKNREGITWQNQPLTLECHLAVANELADICDELSLIAEDADEAGYHTLGKKLILTGSLKKIDKEALYNFLRALAFRNKRINEKSAE